MATIRKDPLGLVGLTAKMEKAAAEKATTKVAETAAMSNDVPGLCPVCRTAMTRIMAKETPVYWCQVHSVVLPTED